jgi:hypothetical protein
MLHHGREIQCVALIPAPEGQMPVAVITGGEDGTIQRLLYTSTQVSRTFDGLSQDVRLRFHMLIANEISRMHLPACITLMYC